MSQPHCTPLSKDTLHHIAFALGISDMSEQQRGLPHTHLLMRVSEEQYLVRIAARSAREVSEAGRNAFAIPIFPTLKRHPLSIQSTWYDLLKALPLSPNSFIAGSAATFIALHSLGITPLFIPGDVDIFCLQERHVFVSMIREFIQHAIINASDCFPRLDDSVFDSDLWKVSVYCSYGDFAERPICISFMLVSACQTYGRRSIHTMSGVMSLFDIDICRIAICDPDSWMCSDFVCRQLALMTMHYNFAARNCETIGYTQRHDRIRKYNERGFLLSTINIDFKGILRQPSHLRVAFCNNAMSLLQEILTKSFAIEDTTFLPDPLTSRTASSLIWTDLKFKFTHSQHWIRLIENLHLNANTFIAGEAATWLVLASIDSSIAWRPSCVHVFCAAINQEEFKQKIKKFITSSSCDDMCNGHDASWFEQSKFTAFSSIGKVCFILVSASDGFKLPMDRIVEQYDISMLRVVVNKVHGYFCSPSVKNDLFTGEFAFCMIPRPSVVPSKTINRIHMIMTYGYSVRSMHIHVAGIRRVPPHERIAMFHNGIILCMSLTNGPCAHNHFSDLMGTGGIRTLYPRCHPVIGAPIE